MSQIKALKELSAVENKPVAQLIREAVDAFLRATPGKDREAVKRRAIGAAGGFRSGVPDLAAHHDDYLAEAYGDVEPR